VSAEFEGGRYALYRIQIGIAAGHVAIVNETLDGASELARSVRRTAACLRDLRLFTSPRNVVKQFSRELDLVFLRRETIG